MAGERPSDQGGDAPRTDLPPTREPYTDDYFGTGEEEGVVRERDAGKGKGDVGEEDDGGKGRGRSAAEDAAGGDREIF
jgi:hypothetical protein